MATLDTYWSANTYEKRWISQRDGHERGTPDWGELGTPRPIAAPIQ